MDESTTFGPFGAQMLTNDEVERFLNLFVDLQVRCADATEVVDTTLGKWFISEANRFREIRWSIAPTDTFWLLTEPPTSTEFIKGSVSLVVIRNGKLLDKFCLLSG